ncbi:hypothetical protein A3F07_04315 [candidate division WWE3 bacterium RIFCSPHIGHO2_12_FULL_38_15]|uniref:DUF4412 domain-containing protein n=1 Tax=candidate division WWE3 bacterium RIFCSPHIGHO2_02_FULL_38_14 TaxID=1802620 RepID=A0A1F4V8R4_UNCKA|nr:MAG: hypothetical protein A3F07_04315 [candidate division WWE3 bacterium RIFCSPHIGHO2_12_FULL_38_15]OGC52917.1 MAG: hypothetical protein A3B64_02820 [candidate division WWE3 bacterium RIFCSPLOWO2_01_FULL_37_24]OGC53320.1 MAG: hypothetical protein A3D91_02835 [candidate division WWE3 bacterium RIFCSPHIGHO2_02_FULL_38_14]HLB51833.1 hypothetical protein [Patescibacteria group bacterium]
MNKQKVSLGILLLLTSLVLTACLPLINTQKQQSDTSESKPATGTSGQNNDQINNQQVSGSLLDMMKLNKKLTCNYTGKDDNGKTTFTTEMFVSGNKVRNNVRMTDNLDKTLESYMVSDGEWFYIWSNASDQGTKMKISEMENIMQETTKDINNQPTNNVDLNKVSEKFDFSCNTWNPDMSMFEVPSDITFIDLQETLDKLKDQLGGFKEAGCNACNMIQDANAKVECLKNLGC